MPTVIAGLWGTRVWRNAPCKLVVLLSRDWQVLWSIHWADVGKLGCLRASFGRAYIADKGCKCSLITRMDTYSLSDDRLKQIQSTLTLIGRIGKST